MPQSKAGILGESNLITVLLWCPSIVDSSYPSNPNVMSSGVIRL